MPIFPHINLNVGIMCLYLETVSIAFVHKILQVKLHTVKLFRCVFSGVLRHKDKQFKAFYL